MVGARLTALRLSRTDGAAPALGGLAGSAVGALVVGLLTIFRRPTVG